MASGDAASGARPRRASAAAADAALRVTSARESEKTTPAATASAAIASDVADDNDGDEDDDEDFQPDGPRSKASRRRAALKAEIRVLDPRLPYLFPKGESDEPAPQYGPESEFYESESEDELDADTNTVGNIPMEWYVLLLFQRSERANGKTNFTSRTTSAGISTTITLATTSLARSCSNPKKPIASIASYRAATILLIGALCATS